MEKIKAYLLTEGVISNSKEAFSLHNKSNFGEKINGKIQYSILETIYLLEKEKMELFSKDKKIELIDFLRKIKKSDKKIEIKYAVFKDLRDKGYIVKTALKFGAEFRVYDKGKKPDKTHSKWLVLTDKESGKISWHEFAAKNRVAHSTKKSLLIAILDEEGKVLYYETKWLKT